MKKKPGPNEAFICRKCKNDQSALTQQFGLLETAVKNQSEFMEKYKQEKDDTLKKVVENQTSVIEQLQLTKNENALYVKRQALQKLPKFNGNTKEWPRFKAIYEKTSTEGSFSKLENATRLLDALSGDALNLVGSQLVNPDNVENAFKSLEKYFGNSDMIYDSLVQELCATKPIKNGNHEAFVSFTIAVVNVVENLKLMGMASRLDDTRLVRELMMKLPPPQQERWITYAAEKQSKKLDTFSQFLELRTSILNELRIASGSSSSDPTPSTSKGPVYVQSEVQPKFNKRCHLCKIDNHDIVSCWKFKAMSVKDRWNKVKELNLCFGCLNRAYHRLAECRKSQKCDINGCTRYHSKLLHYDENQNEARSEEKEWRRQEPRKEPEKEKSKEPEDEGSNTNLIHSENSLLMILPVTVEANGIAEDTYAFLDPGSKFSLIETYLADRLKLKGTEETLTMVCAKRKVVTEEHSIRTALTISGRGKHETYNLSDVRTVTDIGLPKGYQNAKEIVKSSQKFKGIPLPTFRNVQPTILIGANNPKLLMQIEAIEHPANALIITKTHLGWCALGNEEKAENSNHNLMLTSEENEINLNDRVKSCLTPEKIGVKPFLEEKEAKIELRSKQTVDKANDHAHSIETVKEVIEVTGQVIKINAEAEFELKNIVQNSQKVIYALPTAEVATKQILSDFEVKEAVENILDISHCKRSPLKRRILKFVMSISVLLGLLLLSYSLISPKVQIQKTWHSNIDWEQPLTPILLENWKNWIGKLREIEKFEIARVLAPDAATRIKMSTCCDLEENFMCTVEFFRFIIHGEIEFALVMSTTKVAPIEVLLIPRLELQAALLGSRLANAARLDHGLRNDETYFYSDSGTAPALMFNDAPRHFKLFLEKRVYTPDKKL